MSDRCPSCGTCLIGNPIPDEHRRHKPDHDEQVTQYGHCYCLPYGDATHFQRVIGIEVSGVYDGVLFWLCPDCDHAWPRWVNGDRLGVLSAEHAARHNEERAA